MWQLQSPAPWSGLSILSATSWLFKRAKAQRCSFLNTQIHLHQERDHCLAKENPPPAFFLSSSSSLFPLSPHLGLRLFTSHYPPSSIGLITPRLVLLFPPTAPSLSHNLSFIAPLTLLFILVWPFTFPHLSQMTLGILSLRPGHHPSIPHVPSIFCCSDIDWLMPLGHSSHHVRLDLAPISKGIGLPPNGW